MMQAEMASLDSSPPCLAPIPPAARPWQRRRATQILCALGIALPMTAIAAWIYDLPLGTMTPMGMLLGPLLGGGALIFWILFLHLVVCGDNLERLGFRMTRPGLDVLLGLGLGVLMLALQYGFNAAVARLFPPRAPAPEIVDLLAALARDPWLLALWLGPVIWIGVAFFEELARAFLLRRLCLLGAGPLSRCLVILLVSALTGLVHVYQGSAAVVAIGVQSVFLGWFFLRTGRVRALIVSHAVYDSAQIILAVVMIRRMGL